MDTLWRKQNIVTRSISAENITGEKGKGGMATDDVSSVAYFYLDAPYAYARPLPDADGLEII